MRTYTVATLEELRELLATFGDDALYRGQVQQFGPDFAPKMNTSFSRNGCIPPLMLRWTHYASFILAALLGRARREISTEFTQAILQHYGWRSFYLDASADPAVSAWFASHVFRSSRSVELCEDCFEDPVFLVKLMAKYEFEEGAGILYVLSREAVRRRGLDLFDLFSIPLLDCRPRFRAQKAWLVGPLSGDLPRECIAASIRAPRSLFQSYAAGEGLLAVADLFPPEQEDPVLNMLKSMPWNRLDVPEQSREAMSFFVQPLELPEYHDSFRKHNSPHNAYYQGGRIRGENLSHEALWFDVPESVVYGHVDPASARFPRLTSLLKEDGRHFIFEIDNLVRRPGTLNSEYMKGVAITKCDDGLFAVADLAVDHPGLQLTGFGINMGWHYRILGDASWVRELNSEDCPCGNASIHEHHLSMLAILEDCLQSEPMAVVRRTAPAAADSKT